MYLIDRPKLWITVHSSSLKEVVSRKTILICTNLSVFLNISMVSVKDITILHIKHKWKKFIPLEITESFNGTTTSVTNITRVYVHI